MHSNCFCSCSFEREIIKIGRSSHKMYSNKILNFQESMTSLNAYTKKSGNLLKAPHAIMSSPKYVTNTSFWEGANIYKDTADHQCCILTLDRAGCYGRGVTTAHSSFQLSVFSRVFNMQSWSPRMPAGGQVASWRRSVQNVSSKKKRRAVLNECGTAWLRRRAK